MRGFDMRDNYDFSKSVKNPYTKKLKKQVTIRLDQDTISYFKELAEEKGLPYLHFGNSDTSTAFLTFPIWPLTMKNHRFMAFFWPLSKLASFLKNFESTAYFFLVSGTIK